MKIVVFDLDETLGYFSEFGIFWDSLSTYIKKNDNIIITQDIFNKTLDLFPEVVRPNIINILYYLKDKKNSKCCTKLMIYTNNNGPKEWAQKIINYFENKIDCQLFDQIISAFKINGKQIEFGRTTHSKTYADLVRCSKIPANAEICFMDDIFYPEMSKSNIYYINIQPYYHDLGFDEMINRFNKSTHGIKIINNDGDFQQKIMRYMNQYQYKNLDKDPQEYEIDKIIGKQILMHLNIFFNNHNKNRTLRNQRRNITKNHKTMRNR